MTREPSLFDAERAPDTRELVKVLNATLKRTRPPKTARSLPDFTVPGLDRKTGHRRP